MVSASIRLPLLRMFDGLWRDLGRPKIYAIPWQTPSGATYDAEADAWVDGSGDIVTKAPSALTYTEIPALWGADAETVALALGGLNSEGDVIAIAKAGYQSILDGAMMVVTGSLSGDKYSVRDIENAPDGGAAIFVVARLRLRNG